LKKWEIESSCIPHFCAKALLFAQNPVNYPVTEKQTVSWSFAYAQVSSIFNWPGRKVDYRCSGNKQEFNCRIKYSSLQNVKEKNYPATLVLTGDHEDPVARSHSFKLPPFAEKSKSGNPMLIRIDVNAEHEAGKPTLKTNR
jgi:hypothetical protein